VALSEAVDVGVAVELDVGVELDVAVAVAVDDGVEVGVDDGVEVGVAVADESVARVGVADESPEDDPGASGDIDPLRPVTVAVLEGVLEGVLPWPEVGDTSGLAEVVGDTSALAEGDGDADVERDGVGVGDCVVDDESTHAGGMTIPSEAGDAPEDEVASSATGRPAGCAWVGNSSMTLTAIATVVTP
jgi:hypothetical protein